MNKKITMMDQVEDTLEKVADKMEEGTHTLKAKVLEGATYIEEKAYKGMHKLTQGTESVVQSTLEGLEKVEIELKHK